MPIIRLFLLLTVLVSSATHAEIKLALSTDHDTVAPLTLTTASDIELELVQSINQNNDQPMVNVWDRIRNGFAMRELDNPLIAKHEQWYASRPDYMARMTDRARRYLHYITVEVERRGMPSEIALLPMIESAFNPGAYSTGHASGIWQFIPSTGKNFGMQQNWWYDGRRDVISATNGALDYLQKLHGMFGDWELALAAYNWGEGAVQRAQERNRRHGLPTDYASLKMPPETRNYVPKLLAVKNIIANPAKFGLTLEEIPNEPYFAPVSTARHIDVKLAAQLANISIEEFIALNPAHNRPVILQGNSDLILLPVSAAETFRVNLDMYDKPLVSWQAYQPKKGERLDRLAPRFGLSVEDLKSVNGLSVRSSTSTGQTLLVPASGNEADSEFTAFNMNISPMLVKTIKYVVRKGDTLVRLARRYHVSIASIKQSNGSLKAIKVGQTINIEQVAHRKPSSRLSKYSDRSRKAA